MVYDRHQIAGLRFQVLGASLAAWLVMVAWPLWSGEALPASLCGSGSASWLTQDWLVSAGLGWMLMIVAMMLPMSVPALAHVRRSTFAHGRWRAMALFLAGYGAIWLMAGWAMKALEMLVRSATTSLYLPALGAGVLALVWQASPAKQCCLNRCHVHRPLAAFGWRAALDALRLGLRHGAWCVASCSPLMLLLLLLPQGHVVGMMAASVFMFAERLDPPRPPAWRLRGLKTVSLSLQREWAWRKQAWPAVCARLRLERR